MFITAGSCSVMLVCPTRRTCFCHGCEAASGAATRAGSATNRKSFSLALSTTLPAVLSKTCSDDARGRTAAPVESPVFRKVRRLSISLRSKRREQCNRRRIPRGPKFGHGLVLPSGPIQARHVQHLPARGYKLQTLHCYCTYAQPCRSWRPPDLMIESRQPLFGAGAAWLHLLCR